MRTFHVGRWTVLAATLWWTLFAGCTERKFSNPLDPRNPVTRGRPSSLRAYSVLDSVFLRWDPLNLEGLRGIRIWRATGDANFELRATVEPEAFSFVDAELRYERTYRYYITVLGADFESPPSDTVQITPGPTSILVVDPYVGKVMRFSHDGQHLIWESSLAAYPYDVAIDRRRGKVWVPDALEASVLCLSLRWGSFILRVRGFWRPWRLSVDPFSGTLLVADYFGRQVVKIDQEGAELWKDDSFRRPVDVASAVGGSFWVLDQQTKSLARYSGPGGEKTQECPFALRDPRQIEVDAKGMNLWVADVNAIYYYDYRQDKWEAVLEELTNVRAISSSPTGDACWVLEGTSGSDWSSRVFRVDRFGNVTAESRGWEGATDIAWNWFDGGCVLVEESQHRLVRLDGSGRLKSSYSNLIRPHYVEVE